MMDPIEQPELSGLLDNELEPARAEEVRRLVAADSKLRVEFEKLEALDRAWTDAASHAAFQPRVALPLRRARVVAVAALGIVLLLVIRFLSKASPSFTLSVAVHAGALILIIAGLVMFSGWTRAPRETASFS